MCTAQLPDKNTNLPNGARFTRLPPPPPETAPNPQQQTRHCKFTFPEVVNVTVLFRIIGQIIV